MSILVGTTGNIIKGHVLDVSLKPFQEALRFYDPLLYVRWNPKKLKGWGCWEIRRAPEMNSIQEIFEFEGNTIIKVGPVENNFISHILDCAFLNYDQLRKLKEMDTFSVGPKQWLDNLEYNEKKRKEYLAQKAKQNRRDAAKTYKKEINAFREYVQSGNNPHLIAAYWDKVREAD